LRLNEEGRLIIRDGKLLIKRPTESEVYVFLFDHMLLVGKKKDNVYKIVKRPIPLELVLIQSDAAQPTVTNQESSSKQYLINIHVPSRYGVPFTLHAATLADKTSWVEAIEKQQRNLIEKKKMFDFSTLVSVGFPKTNPINCSCVYHNQLIIGTDQGLFVSSSSTGANTNDSYQNSIKVIDLERIVQIDVLPKIDMLLVLAGTFN
jgi:RHO1 GDP-GTP exchange protein 1/2